MSDTLTLNRGGLPAPAVLNPLAAAMGATQAAEQTYQLRDAQAQQAWGNALQQATDPNTGVVDFQKAQALASKDPIAAMGMAKNLANTTQLRGLQQEQAQRWNNLIGASSLTIMRKPTDENMEMVRTALKNAGLPADQVDAEIDGALKLDGPGRQRWAYQHGIGRMDPSGALGREAGATTMEQFGGTTAPVTTQGGAPGYGAPQVNIGSGIPHSMDPNTYYSGQPAVEMYDANGQVTTDPNKAVRWVKKDVPHGPAMGAPPPGSIGGKPGATSAQPGNPPGTPAAGTVPSKGRITPTTDNPALRKPNANQPPASPGVITEPPAGQPEQLKADLEARTKDLSAVPQQQTQVQNMKHAFDALSFITTGQGQQIPNNLFNTLAGFGLLPPGAVNRLEKYEEYKKYATMQILQQGLLQGTDLGRQLATASNPSEALSTAANRELLRNNIGVALQGMAAALAEKDPANAGTAAGYIGRRSDLANNTDPRGFAWPLYSAAEQQKMLADAAAADKRNGNTNASDRLHRAIGMASRLKLDIPFAGGGNAQP